MKSSPRQTEDDSIWTKTPFANLVRYKPSQKYFARIRVQGKLIRRSLKTTSLTVAKLRLTRYDLRYLFATRCIESGADIPTVSRWLGHKDTGALAINTFLFS